MISEKRHQRFRLLKNRKRYFGRRLDLEAGHAWQMAVNTPHPCSCRGCGNPRHHEKGMQRLTMQERRMRDVEREAVRQIAEAEDPVVVP